MSSVGWRLGLILEVANGTPHLFCFLETELIHIYTCT